MAETVIEVDSRKRISLGALATADRYVAEREPSGVIILRPAVVLTEDEVKLMNRPDILEAVERSRQRDRDGHVSMVRPTRNKTA